MVTMPAWALVNPTGLANSSVILHKADSPDKGNTTQRGEDFTKTTVNRSRKVFVLGQDFSAVTLGR